MPYFVLTLRGCYFVNRGKLHHMGAEQLVDVYGQDTVEKFRALCVSHDPEGKFRNEWFDRLVFGDDANHLELVVPATPSDALDSTPVEADASVAHGEQE